MLRRLFTLAAGLSLLLALAAAALWVRSHFVRDQLVWRRLDGVHYLQSERGTVILSLNRGPWTSQPPSWYGLTHTGAPAASPGAWDPAIDIYLLSVGPRDTFVDWHRAGFTWRAWQPPDKSVLIAAAAAPHWSLTAAAAILPLARTTRRLHSRRRHRRAKAHRLCPTCGYDLRATPTRCPECGVAPAHSQIAP